MSEWKAVDNRIYREGMGWVASCFDDLAAAQIVREHNAYKALMNLAEEYRDYRIFDGCTGVDVAEIDAVLAQAEGGSDGDD